MTAMQKAANQKYGKTPDNVLQIAQSLYESKYLSYPRTGSRYIPDDVFANMPALIAQCQKLAGNSLNASYYNNTTALSKGSVNSSKVTDHHALLPTENTPDLDSLTKPERTVYMMVLSRLFEAFHANCIKDVTDVRLMAGGVELFAKGTITRSAGWREVCAKDTTEDDAPDKEKEQELPLPVLNGGARFAGKTLTDNLYCAAVLNRRYRRTALR
jgi:DNA topoisomerase-3